MKTTSSITFRAAARGRRILCMTLAALCLMALASCKGGSKTPSAEELAAQIESLETQSITDPLTLRVDSAQGAQLLELYSLYANTYPTDSLAPVFLEHGAKLCADMDNIDGMVQYYDNIIDNYPDYSNLDECYYTKGILLDNSGRKDEARKAYEDFLEAFPDHFLADDIRRAIPLLDMSDELLIQHLNSLSEKQN